MSPSRRPSAAVLRVVLAAGGIALLAALSPPVPADARPADAAPASDGPQSEAAGAAERSAAEAQAVPSGRDGFTAAMDFLVRGGGVWRSPNGRHQAGDGTAVEFRYRFEPLFDGSLVKTAITGIGEDGAETVYWQVFTAWHPGEDSIRLFNFGRDGDFGHGTFQVVSPERRRLEIDFVNSEGKPYRVKEEIERLDADRFHSTSYILQDGEWAQFNESVWTRVEG